MEASHSPHFKDQHTQTKLIEAACVKSGWGGAGRLKGMLISTFWLAAQIWALVRSRLLGRGAMWNSTEHSNHNSPALSCLAPSHFPFSFPHRSLTFSSFPLLRLILNLPHLVLSLLFFFSTVSVSHLEWSYKHLVSCSFPLPSEGSHIKKQLYFS